MGFTYGAGLCVNLPGWDADDYPATAALTDLVGLGLTRCVNEVVDDRVLRVEGMPGQPVRQSWLTPEQAAPVLRAAARTGGGAPWSALPDIDFQVFLPHDLQPWSGRVPAARPFQDCTDQLWAGLDRGMAALEGWSRVKDDDGEIHWDREFITELREQMRICQQYDLIFMIGD